MFLPKRSAPTSKTMAPKDPWIDPEFKDSLPALYWFLNEFRYEDGTTRLTGSMSLFTKLGTLTAAINDNDRGLSAFVTATTWAELLFLVDQGILNDSLEWRSKTPPAPAQKTPF